MLKVFLKRPGQVLSREQILAHAWGYDFDPASNVVDVYVRTRPGRRIPAVLSGQPQRDWPPSRGIVAPVR